MNSTSDDIDEVKRVKTPSGTVIEAKVSDIRTFFSAQEKGEQTNQVHLRQLRNKRSPIIRVKGISQALKIDQPNKQRLRSRSLPCISEQTPKHKVRRQKIGVKNNITNIATPRLRKRNTSAATNMSLKEQRELEAEVSDQMVMDTSVDANIKDPQSNTQLETITHALEQMVAENNLEAPTTMDVKTVHAMFKSIKEDSDKKFTEITEMCEAISNTPPPTLNLNEEQINQIDELATQLEKMKMKNRVLGSIVQRIWTNFTEYKERVDKLDNNT